MTCAAAASGIEHAAKLAGKSIKIAYDVDWHMTSESHNAIEKISIQGKSGERSRPV